MEIKEIATIKFDSVDLENEGVAIVRRVDTNIAVCLSVKHGGDTEVLISPKECQDLINVLKRALA